MDRAVGDDGASDVAVTDSWAAKSRRSGWDTDTIYRRPSAHPPAESTTGGSWLTGDADLPGAQDSADAEPAEPTYGPATPATASRTSFGFTGGPISPARSSGAATSARRSPASTGATAEPDSAPSTAPAPQSRRRAAYAPAVQEAAPISPSWPPPPRFTPEQDALERVPDGTGEQRRVKRRDMSVDGTGEQRRVKRRDMSVDGTGEQRRVKRRDMSVDGTGEQRRVKRRDMSVDGTGEQPRVKRGEAFGGTGEHRRVNRKLGDGAGEQRRVALREPVDALPPRQSRAVTMAIVMLSTMVLLAGTAVAIIYFSGSEQAIDSVLRLGAGNTKNRTVTAPLDNRTAASFELLAGANTVHVTIGELGDELYRISTPEDAGIKPSPQIRNDDVKLQVMRDGDGTGGEIEVVLAAKVRWALRFSGYAETQLIDVSGGRVSGIEMVAGMRRAELTLPQPTGTVPLKVNGVVDQMIVKSPVGSPVRIKVGAGAQTVVAGTRTVQDVAAGSTLTPKGWESENRYDLAAGARITSLAIESV